MGSGQQRRQFVQEELDGLDQEIEATERELATIAAKLDRLREARDGLRRYWERRDPESAPDVIMAHVGGKLTVVSPAIRKGMSLPAAILEVLRQKGRAMRSIEIFRALNDATFEVRGTAPQKNVGAALSNLKSAGRVRNSEEGWSLVPEKPEASGA